MGRSGLLPLNGGCIMHIVSPGSGADVRLKAEVIPFPIHCQSGQLLATLVARLRSVNIAAIRRTYFTMDMEAGHSAKDILLKLKDILGLLNVRYSGLSVRRGKIHVCASFFKRISPSPRPSVSLSGQAAS